MREIYQVNCPQENIRPFRGYDVEVVKLIDLLKKESNTKMRKKLMTKITHMNNKLILKTKNTHLSIQYKL